MLRIADKSVEASSLSPRLLSARNPTISIPPVYRKSWERDERGGEGGEEGRLTVGMKLE